MSEVMRLSAMILDPELYPRQGVSPIHIQDLLLALKSGAKLPPIVVDAATGKVVDGFHRHGALLQFHGGDAEVAVERIAYASEAELFLDAARRNRDHGRKLARSDQRHIILRAQELGVTEVHVLAEVLAVPAERVQTLSVQVVITPTGERVPTKQGVHHLGGQAVTEEQLANIRKMRGSSTSRAVGELLSLLQTNMVDLRNPDLCVRLHRLAEVILETVPHPEGRLLDPEREFAVA